ncbi:MAG: hypothetical protein O0W93_09570, partial [Methanocorpusculum sp.]|nr:hypothetical protein [Methanocorpusculum sp.]
MFSLIFLFFVMFFRLPRPSPIFSSELGGKYQFVINNYIHTNVNISGCGDQHLPRKMQLMPGICMD